MQKQDNQHEHTFSNYVRIQDVSQKTCLRRWTIGKCVERGSGIYVLPARHDDDNDMWQRVGERAAAPWITPTIKHGGGSVMVGVFLTITNLWICPWGRTNRIKLAITAYCCIMQSHLERSLWVKDLYSCKIMTQSILKKNPEVN